MAIFISGMPNRLALSILLSALLLTADPPQLQIKKKVEPEWDPSLTAFFPDPVKVDMVIDDSGNPFKLEASAPIPDNVVLALSAWRFRTSRAFKTSLVVPIRRPFGLMAEMELRRGFVIQPGDAALKSAKEDKLDAAKAALLETKILSVDTSARERLDAATALLVWYTRDAPPESGKTIERRVALLVKLVETEPAAPVLATAFATLNGDEGPLGSTAGYAQIRQAWMKRLDPPPADADILRNAMNFLESATPKPSRASCCRASIKVRVWKSGSAICGPVPPPA